MQHNLHQGPSNQSSILSSIKNHIPKHSLSREFYTSSSIYNLDLASVWDQSWIWVGHTSQLDANGDYFVFEFGTESVIVVRDNDGEIRAHQNVCRHRGSRVCLELTGNARSFTCPYHAWTYDLQGQLLSSRLMPDDFNSDNHGLLAVNLITYQGLIFICLSDNPPPIEAALAKMDPMLSPFELSNMKIAHQASYPVKANWKLVMENYLECYHCAPSHKEYSKSHSLKDPDAFNETLAKEMDIRSTKAGLVAGVFSETAEAATHLGTDVYYRRYPLYTGYQTGSRSGAPLAPLLGKLKSYDGGASDVQIGPLNFFLAYSDHVIGYRFIPRGLQSTDIQTVWMVHKDATESSDYNLAELTWLWHVTTLDDERIIGHNQQGVNSLYYQPGPLSTMEWGISEFHRNYLAILSQNL